MAQIKAKASPVDREAALFVDLFQRLGTLERIAHRHPAAGPPVDLWVDVTGDTMTGPLIIHHSSNGQIWLATTAPTQAAYIAYYTNAVAGGAMGTRSACVGFAANNPDLRFYNEGTVGDVWLRSPENVVLTGGAGANNSARLLASGVFLVGCVTNDLTIPGVVITGNISTHRYIAITSDSGSACFIGNKIGGGEAPAPTSPASATTTPPAGRSSRRHQASPTRPPPTTGSRTTSARSTTRSRF